MWKTNHAILRIASEFWISNWRIGSKTRVKQWVDVCWLEYEYDHELLKQQHLDSLGRKRLRDINFQIFVSHIIIFKLKRSQQIEQINCHVFFCCYRSPLRFVNNLDFNIELDIWWLWQLLWHPALIAFSHINFVCIIYIKKALLLWM